MGTAWLGAVVQSLPQGGALTWPLGGGLSPHHVAAPQASRHVGAHFPLGAGGREGEGGWSGWKVWWPGAWSGRTHGFRQRRDQPAALWEWAAGDA